MITKTPVFFIATQMGQEPLTVNFYTKKGQQVAFDDVEKVRTKKGVLLYKKEKTNNVQKAESNGN
jgi:hypothetical protein